MDEIVVPLEPKSLVKLPWASDIWLCPTHLHRWIKDEDGDWSRDYHGEAEWEKMADYVGQTYEDVARKELDYALSKAND